MADDKRNALFSKMFSKDKNENKKAEYNSEEAVDAAMSYSENPESAPQVQQPTDDDIYADWLEESANSAELPEDDISDAIDELFGDSAENANDDEFVLPVFDENAISEDMAESEPVEAYEDVPENVYEEIPEEAYGDDFADGDDNAEVYDYEEDQPVAEEYAEEDLPEESMPEEAPVDEDTEILLTALGYEGASAESVKRIVTNNETIRSRSADLSLAYGYEGREYSSHAQTASIKSAYARNKFNVLIRFAGTAIFTLILFIYDAFGKSFGGALDASVYPAVNILISLQLLLITAAFSVKQLYVGINGIFKGEPIVHSVSVTALLMTVLYDAVLAIAAPTSFTLYNLPAAICLLFGVAHDYCVLAREIDVFDRLSSWQSVATMEKIDPTALAAELGEGRNGGNTIGRAFRMRKGEFAESYFRHINCRHPMSKLYNYIIAPIVALSVVFFIISLASKRSVVDSMNVLLAVNLFALPTFMLVGVSFPFFTLVSKRLNADSVIFSEADVNDYCKVDTVVFEESDLFDENSLAIKRISLCDKNRMQDVFDIMCDVSALYDRIGGRIAGAFRANTADGDIPEDARVISVSDGGFEGTARGRHYCVGSDAYLSANGISVMRYYDDKYIASTPGGVVLHIAVDGAEIFKLYLTYRISDSMLSVMSELSQTNARIIIRTVDPNINLDLISRLLTSTFNGKLTLVRKPYVEGNVPEIYDDSVKTIDGGVLVNGDNTEAVLDIISASRLFSAFSKLNFYISVAVFAIGVILATFLAAVGAIVGISSLYIALFQILSVIPAVILANLTLK